ACHCGNMGRNGIDYGLRAACAEGLNVIHRANAGADAEEVSAEIAPLQDPEYYRYDIDIAEVAELWRRGSVVASWLLDLTAGALGSRSGLDRYGGPVARPGRGRWAVHAGL